MAVRLLTMIRQCRYSLEMRINILIRKSRASNETEGVGCGDGRRRKGARRHEVGGRDGTQSEKVAGDCRGIMVAGRGKLLMDRAGGMLVLA